MSDDDDDDLFADSGGDTDDLIAESKKDAKPIAKKKTLKKKKKAAPKKRKRADIPGKFWIIIWQWFGCIVLLARERKLHCLWYELSNINLWSLTSINRRWQRQRRWSWFVWFRRRRWWTEETHVQTWTYGCLESQEAKGIRSFGLR